MKSWGEWSHDPRTYELLTIHEVTERLMIEYFIQRCYGLLGTPEWLEN